MSIFNNAFDLIKYLNDAGYEARIVGGAVRDYCMGNTPKDIDIATTALPEETRKVMTDLGFRVIDTGLKHGTITVVYFGEHYEITTLRVDVECDGRHAEVEFTTDWEADASRRDFTINAMSMDYNYNIFDYFGGRDNINSGIVKFVGDPTKRIEEDGLRVLRFIRFIGQTGFYGDPSSLNIIKTYNNPLKNVSDERKIMELEKILMTNNPRAILMLNIKNVFKALFGNRPKLNMFTYTDMDTWELRLYSMGVGPDWFAEMPVSRKVYKTICAMENFRMVDVRYAIIKHGREFVENWRKLNRIENKFPIPHYVPLAIPFTNEDLIEAGFKGADISYFYDFLLMEWCKSGCNLDESEIKELIQYIQFAFIGRI